MLISRSFIIPWFSVKPKIRYIKYRSGCVDGSSVGMKELPGNGVCEWSCGIYKWELKHQNNSFNVFRFNPTILYMLTRRLSYNQKTMDVRLVWRQLKTRTVSPLRDVSVEFHVCLHNKVHYEKKQENWWRPTCKNKVAEDFTQAYRVAPMK